MPQLARITVYPLKSFESMTVQESIGLPNGALKHDRQFALIDGTGKFFNAKRSAAVHRVTLKIDPTLRVLFAQRRQETDVHRWELDTQRDDMHRWLNDCFGLRLTLVENTKGGFPDDEESPGPTLVSTATLLAVSDWFPGLSLDDARQRFRANIEIDGVDPFWEDRLFRGDDQLEPFRVGDVTFGGVNPCQRCAVPSRDPRTGDVWPEFAKCFAERRQRELPIWSDRGRFNHFYRLAVNTRLIAAGTLKIRVGDEISMSK